MCREQGDLLPSGFSQNHGFLGLETFSAKTRTVVVTPCWVLSLTPRARDMLCERQVDTVRTADRQRGFAEQFGHSSMQTPGPSSSCASTLPQHVRLKGRRSFLP